ncbi:BLUF domain-containing protein [Vibrio vulnificus]|nr:BLUF domain-containing protein [Vibrio vulnificus]
MKLTRLIYTSTITEQMTHADVDAILESAKHNNLKLGITGILFFNSQHFLQCLEGERNTVNQVYRSIINDSRHHNVVILDYSEIDSRDFHDWTMGYIPASSTTKPVTLKFSATSAFSRYEMTGNSAYLLLLELKSKLPNI